MYQQARQCTHSTEYVLFRAVIDNALRQSKRSVSNQHQIQKLRMNKTEYFRQQYRYKKKHKYKHGLTLSDPFRTHICQKLLHMTIQHAMQKRDQERPRRRGILREAFRFLDYLGQHKDVYHMLKSFVRSLGMDDQVLLMDKRSHSNPVEFES
jgi:hypothetical protein